MEKAKPIIFIFFSWLLFACQNNSSKKIQEELSTPTTGKLTVYLDHGDSLLFQQLKEMFELKYEYAKINLICLPEDSIRNIMAKGNPDLVVLHRKLDKEEEAFYKSKAMLPKCYEVAKTGIAIISNNAWPRNSISYSDLKNALLGNYNLLPPDLENAPIFMDNIGGSNFNYFINSFQSQPKSIKINYLNSPSQVINKVIATPHSFGFVNVNWIGDAKDSLAIKNLQKLNIWQVENIQLKKYFEPAQSFLATNEYPLRQYIYMINLESRNGLATGFIAYALSQPGQLIVKKSLLAPAINQPRTIKLE